jgi:hypothetical protein
MSAAQAVAAMASPSALTGIAFALLVAGVAAFATVALRAGWRRDRFRDRDLLLFSTVTAGGLIGAPFWWFGAPAAFAWILPPLAGRLLAVAGLAFAATCLIVLVRPSTARLRLAAIMLLVYLAPIAGAAVLLHADRFDPAAPVVVSFFATAALLLAGAASLLASTPPGATAPPEPPLARALLALTGGLLLAWGAALFATADGPRTFVNAWPGDAPTGRLIAAMLATAGAAALCAVRHAGAVAPATACLAVYGFGGASACAVNLAAGNPLPVAYAAGLFLAGCAGIAAGALQRAAVNDAG